MEENDPIDVNLPIGEKLPSFNLVDPSLLEKIDRLFACNAGDYVDLPQLVVVGHQSSGKSSVLEGLTGLPFPRDSGLCTRFATQITFRRSNEAKISASIIPSKDCSDTHRRSTQSWGKKELDILDAESFAAIMGEVCNKLTWILLIFSCTESMQVIDLMGVGPKSELGSPAFSEDVLVLEIAGPKQEHFSVIDVPGTFKKITEGQTTATDIALVFDMVKGYMENPRSVMLTVVPCTSDIANEDVVQLADDLDPYGNRTLGVLTKPDLVDDGAEGEILNVINGKSHRLKLGWHLVRNLGQRELRDKADSRGSLEDKFFKTKAPWNTIDKAKVGVVALRMRLQKILTDHIRREFPKVRGSALHNRKLKILTVAIRSKLILGRSCRKLRRHFVCWGRSAKLHRSKASF
jgi:GTPase SAR1 family protein